MKIGKVYLVGAGPGDLGLLTIKAKNLIKKADVIVYDRLVGDDIMSIIPNDTKLINVGKNAGNHPVVQSRINEILLEEALLGKTVVRLKGGDPFVFGRGGEELELLVDKNIPFEVVPGITSSISVPAYGGIPVTHRDYCSSLHIITGHAKSDGELNIDFDSLVKLNGTLIFMMSVSTIGQIANGLINANMDKNMPCAIIENGTKPNQRKFIADLQTIEQTVKLNKVKSPSVIVVGKVCSLSDKFDWFSNQPLKGKNILITQPEKKSSILAQKLKAMGANTILYPCIKTEFIRPLNIDIKPYTTIIFTSAEGVKSFLEYLFENNLDSRCLYNKKIACVGEKTALELMKYGIKSDFIPSVYDGEHLASEMISSKFINTSDNILLARAKQGTKDITDILKNENINFTDYPVYKTSYIDHDNIDISSIDIITFTSKSCVMGFVESNKSAHFSNLKAVCIGYQTENAAKKYGFNTVVSDKATIDSMVEKILAENEG